MVVSVGLEAFKNVSTNFDGSGWPACVAGHRAVASVHWNGGTVGAVLCHCGLGDAVENGFVEEQACCRRVCPHGGGGRPVVLGKGGG